jgi:putative PIN family toxin of toxin-antitoxin system
MNADARYVLDANVVVSALLFYESVPGQAFARAQAEGAILISRDLVVELNDVLSREKFDRYVTREEREGFLDALIRESTLVEITESLNVCRDPKDNHVLELALSGKASLIVTGDRDLLALHPFRSILILSPAEFLQTGGKPSGEAGTPS